MTRTRTPSGLRSPLAGPCFPRHFARRSAAVIAAVLVVMTLADGESGAQDAPAVSFGSGGVITTGAEVTGGGTASPGAALAELRERALGAGWSPSQLEAFSELVGQLAEQHLPVEPVLDRALQGIVKGADYNRIDSVCRSLAGRIRRGAVLVDGRFRSHPGNTKATRSIERLELIDRTAFAMEKGVPEATLTDLFTQIPVTGEPADQIGAMNAPVMTLTSLTADGIPVSESIAFVKDVWKLGVRGGDLEGLAMALDAGGNPEVLAWVRESLENGIPPGQVVRELRHGERKGGPPPGQIGNDERRGPREGRGGPPDDPGRRGRGKKDRGKGRP